MRKVIGADPFVLFDKKSGYFYCYATSDVSEDNKAFYIYKTKDLVNYEFVNYALDLNTKNWAKDWYRAPECYYNEKTGWYFLIYSARVKDEYLDKYFEDSEFEEGCKIGIAKSRSPEGPFINICDKPIDFSPYDPEYLDIYKIVSNKMNPEITYQEALTRAPKGVYLSCIDANLFFNDDKIYLYFSRCCYKNFTFDEKYNKFIEESNILGVELERSFYDDPEANTNPSVSVKYKNIHGLNKDGFIKIINYHSDPQIWEDSHINDYDVYNGIKKNRRWSEGSTTFKKVIEGKEKYFILYSCNNFENKNYGVGLATSDDPLGIYKKYENNPIIHQIENVLYSTGHGDLVTLNGEDYYVFHARHTENERRSIYSCKLTIDNHGNPIVSDIIQGVLV